MDKKNTTEISINQSLEKLSELYPKTFHGKRTQAIRVTFHEDITDDRIREGHFQNCKFLNSGFINSGFSGSHFEQCTLSDGEIINSNLQFCDFSKQCIFEGNKKKFEIVSSNLSQSFFHDSTFSNVKFVNTTISQARFINSKFVDINFKTCTLQDNIYQNIIMENVSLVGCNCEYSEFMNVKMDHVALPLHQIPYAYGLLECMQENSSSDIIIDAITSSRAPISAQEYFQLLPDLLNYYLTLEDYFPAIQILLFQKKYNSAEKYINTAIIEYIKNNNFRNLRAICKLVADCPKYDKHFMATLYFSLTKYYNQIGLSEAQKYQYSLYINDIRDILTGNQRNMPSVQLVLRSNLSAKDYSAIGEFHYIIEQCMEENNISTDEFAIEFRHNSDPISFWIDIYAPEIMQLLPCIGMILSVALQDFSYIEQALSVLANTTTIATFIDNIVNKNFLSQNETCSNTSTKMKKSIANKQTRIKKSQFKFSVSSAYFNVNFEQKKEIQYKN